MTRIEAKANLALTFSIAAFFASVVACTFAGFLFVSRDVAERNGTPPVIYVEEQAK